MNYATIKFSKNGEFGLRKIWGGLDLRAGLAGDNSCMIIAINYT